MLYKYVRVSIKADCQSAFTCHTSSVRHWSYTTILSTATLITLISKYPLKMSTSDSNHYEVAKIFFNLPNGRNYGPGDFERVCRSSSLAFEDLPFYLWEEEDAIPGLTPPRLWYGWHFGEKGLLDLVQRQYPSRVLYNRYQEVCLMYTLMRVLPRIICEEFQLPAEFHHLVRVRDAARSRQRQS
ncbi:hypothetical protein CPB85DRAFT_1366507, partial [Mucidula mucida]